MIDNKKYLDYAGLSEFWTLVKDYYSQTVSKADSALQGAYILNRGSESALPLDVVDNKITIDLHDYAKLSDIAEGVNFKGVVDYQSQLPLTGNASGDIYIVRYRGSEGTDPYGAEFIWVVPEGGIGYWEELGNLVNFENYYTKNETNSLLADEVVDRNAAINTAVASEATLRESADIDLGGRIDAEEDARIAADAKEVVDRDDAIASAFNDGNYTVKLHEIRKLFGEEKAVTPENVLDSIVSVGLGDTLVLSDSLIVSSPIEVLAGKDFTLDLSDGGSISSGSVRVLNVNEGATIEIIGGTVDCSTSNYGIVCLDNSSIIIDGTTIENTGSGVAIGTNDNNYNGDLIIKNAEIVGTNYFPSCRNLVIEGSTFSVPAVCDNSCAIYCKSGSITIKNSHFIASVTSRGDWIHSDNGYIGISCAAIFENCDYGNHGNMKISIDADSTFSVVDSPAGSTYDNFGILVIDYNGNTSASLDIRQKYYHAAVSNKTSAPSVHFTKRDVEDPNHVIIKVEEING